MFHPFIFPGQYDKKIPPFPSFFHREGEPHGLSQSCKKLSPLQLAIHQIFQHLFPQAAAWDRHHIPSLFNLFMLQSINFPWTYPSDPSMVQHFPYGMGKTRYKLVYKPWNFTPRVPFLFVRTRPNRPFHRLSHDGIVSKKTERWLHRRSSVPSSRILPVETALSVPHELTEPLGIASFLAPLLRLKLPRRRAASRPQLW